ncbi:uncharacterized protein BDW70DRAFT_166121 [Aspergillus foveolatus]|uniref:uncharacterized protein n=1 Tax=Aspergillus foveolatus TaxID=210207 RepID=UPI003CCD4366
MANQESSTLVGCLIDVSGSMRKVLETGRSDGRAVDRFHAVLDAALDIARKEQQVEPRAKMFVGASGLDRQDGYPSTVDLCGIVEALLEENDQDDRSGHDLIIEIANRNNLTHITEYIRNMLTDSVARIVHACLRRCPEQIEEFKDAIPSAAEIRKSQETKYGSTLGSGALVIAGGSVLCGPLGGLFGAALTGLAAMGADAYEDQVVDSSEGLQLARRICREWFRDFLDFVPRPRSTGARQWLSVEELVYGDTPMREALSRSLSVFQANSNCDERVLVLMSDDHATDGDPGEIATELHSEDVAVACVYLTSDHDIAQRRLYDKPAYSWDKGRRTLFNIASKVTAKNHPIQVLMSMGWQIPCSGEVDLYVSVCTETAVKEFCSLLVSAHLGSTDALPDDYIQDEHAITCKNPLEQGKRKEPCPTIGESRDRILHEFPPGDHGRVAEEVLNQAVQWYRLRYRAVVEMGARQAVLQRRPVLTTFRLSKKGRAKFSQHFSQPQKRRSMLTEANVRPYRKGRDDGGHAVVLYACEPHSLSFLNSWGSDWGTNGGFRVQSPAVLEIDEPDCLSPVRFYDVFWYESDLTPSERAAYDAKAEENLRTYTTYHPSLLELEAMCPLGQRISLISDFSGNAREAKCPRCLFSFVPQPGNLLQVLYARAGLGT